VKNNKNFVLPLLLLILSAGCGEQKTKRLILAHGLDTQHSVHQAMEFMSDRLLELSGGKMGLTIYPNQQLGSERQCIELLQIGSVDMTKVSTAVMEGFVPQFRLLSIPYIFRDRAHAFRVLDGRLGEELLELGTAFRLQGLCYYDSGSRSFYTKTGPVLSPDNIKGRKIRVMSSATSMDMVKALGGAATPISWGELYTALQGGVVDGAENNPPSFYLSRHYEVCPYYSVNEHSTIPDLVLISTHAWNRLTDKERLWLREAAGKSVDYQRELWLKSEEEALKSLREAGVQIVYPDKEPFMRMLAPLRESYKKNPEIKKWIEEIEKAAESE